MGPSTVKVLQENLGTGSQETQRKKTPCLWKITLGKPIESLEGPCSSEIKSTTVFDRKEEDFSVAHFLKKGKPKSRNSEKVKGNSKLPKEQVWRKNFKKGICVRYECNKEYDEDAPHVWAGWSAIRVDSDFIWNIRALNINPKIIGHLMLMLIIWNVLSVTQFLKVV